MAKRTWLITGVAGFIGSHVASTLLERGDTVVGVDNFYSGSRENIKPFAGLPNWHGYEMDIRDPKLETLFHKHQPTHVIHLAAIVSVQECEAQPELAQAVNVDAFVQLLMLCEAYHVDQTFYASSSAVYGMNDHLPLKETEVLSPISQYGETKAANERDAAESTVNTIGFRFFNLFGENQSATGGYAAVIPKWIDALRSGKTPIIYGDGSATRDFCHISLVLHAIDCALAQDLKGHHVFNIGTGAPTTLNDLYAMICEALGQQVEPIYQPWREGDIVHSYADITLAQETLGFTAQADLASKLRDLTHAPASK